MKIEIDQSGKVENTSKPTVIAGYGSNWQKSVIILPRDKRKVQQFFREIGQPKLYISKLFSVLIFYLIKDHYKNISYLIIDQEYPGHEKYIKNQILGILVANNFQIDDISISFKEIGKTSKAHGVAIQAYRFKKSDLNLTVKDILRAL